MRPVSVVISIDELSDAWVLAVKGELDYAESAAFRIETERILRARPPAVIVDFSQVDYLDSSGLGLLLGLAREYGEADGQLVLITSEAVDAVLEMTRLKGVFTLEADVMSALRFLRNSDPPARWRPERPTF